MSSAPLSVLLVTRDPDVKLVAASLQTEGITSRTISSLRDLNRALSGARGQNVVAVFDGDIGGDPSFPIEDVFARLRDLPLVVLLSTEADGGITGDPQRSAAEEFARKPIAPSVLALRIKALALAAEMALPTPFAQSAPAGGPLDLSGDDPRGELTVVFSVKCGSGKSTIAANLAVGLASLYNFQTLLVDADLWFGDIGVLLNLTSSRSSFDICGTDDPDLFELPKAVVEHSSGASVIAVNKAHIVRLIEASDAA